MGEGERILLERLSGGGWKHLAKEKGEDEEDVIDALCGLIKYKMKIIGTPPEHQ